jgi:hypothetical protein
MKCAKHNQDATAICAHCGVALCLTCSQIAASQRTACSETCAHALVKADRAIDTILRKSTQMARVSAYGCFLCGALMIGFGIYARLQYPQLRLAAPLLAFMGVSLLIFGAWYQRAAQKED